MGDIEVCENGVGAARGSCMCSYESSLPLEVNPPLRITRESWETGERRTNEILSKIRPSLASDIKRREIIKYVRGLITASLGCEVFPYGSVPLKTYLPDGDIDFTAISTPNIEDTLVTDVHAVLKCEENNESAHFEVKDVHCIDAEVKLVKCLVQNIVVDISFNQLGGLCTLCFLELVDGIIGKDHLFKRSIILIKAWCYYESRILGAHHGLISTYALETLVLCIFHLYHSSLDGPLAVLYRFLDYFSKFDWENCCVSLNGPVCKSSLPDIVAKGPQNGRDGLLLSEEFLQECFDKFSVPSRGVETDSRAFPLKHLNIIDILKQNNNLGRSINRGNSYRIRSAFKYGARKLGQILILPSERLVDNLNKFFANALDSDRYGNECWADVSDFSQAAGTGSANCLVSTQHFETFLGDSNDKTVGLRNNQKRHTLKVSSSQAMPELNCTSYRDAVSTCHHAGVAKVVAPGSLSSGNRDDSSSCLTLSTDFGISLVEKYHEAPHCNGKIKNGRSHERRRALSNTDDDLNFTSWSESVNSLVATGSICSHNNHENIAPNSWVHSNSAPNNSNNLSSSLRERNLASISKNTESLRPLLELSGQYERYFNNLIYAKYYHLSAPLLLSPTMLNQLQNNNLGETIWQSQQLEPKVYFKGNANGGLGHHVSHVNPPMTSNAATFSSVEKKKSRGTGTYFPKMNYHLNGDSPLSVRGRFQAPGDFSQRRAHKNGLVTAPTEKNLSGEGYHELPVLRNGKSAYSVSFQPQSAVWGPSKANDSSHSSQRHEPGCCEFQLKDVSLPEVITQPASDTSFWLDSASSLKYPAAQSPNSVVESNPESDAESFHLGNDVDFPPLSVQKKVKT